ncbi:MAG: hypothetical protein ACJAS1_007348 [Oleiphilaceae bacterium]|jgi:hypothetical protein
MQESGKELLIKKVFSKSNFRNWHEARVLQYIDLYQWHELNNTRITDPQAAAIIFPELEGERVTQDYEQAVKWSIKST